MGGSSAPLVNMNSSVPGPKPCYSSAPVHTYPANTHSIHSLFPTMWMEHFSQKN